MKRATVRTADRYNANHYDDFWSVSQRQDLKAIAALAAHGWKFSDMPAHVIASEFPKTVLPFRMREIEPAIVRLAR